MSNVEKNNNVMSILKKNPLVLLIVVAVIVGVIVLVVKMTRRSEEAFSASNNENIVENYPQTTPMNIMYSDANGNLATSNDLGLQNLTVNSDSSFGGNVGVNGKVTASSADVSGVVTAVSATLKNLTVKGDSVITGNSTVNGTSRVSTIGANTVNIDTNGSILLGNKFRLNGGKDLYADDDWLRIMNKDNTGYGGGIAAKKLWAEGDASVGGSLSSSSVNTTSVNLYNYGDVKTKLEDLFRRVAALENSTVKKDQKFTLKNSSTWTGLDNWYGIYMSDGCFLKNAACASGTNYGTENTFKIIQ